MGKLKWKPIGEISPDAAEEYLLYRPSPEPNYWIGVNFEGAWIDTEDAGRLDGLTHAIRLTPPRV